MDAEQQSALAKIRRFYDSVYYGRIAERRPVSSHLRRLARRIGIGQGMRLLDVGCGTGEWLRAARERGAQPSGIDLSHKAIDASKAAMPEGDFRCGPAETLPFPDASFHWVTCLGSLEHFVDPARALREMARVARPDAELLILVPNADFLTRRLGLYRGTHQTDAKEEVRTLEQWQALFETAGFAPRERWRDLHVLSLDWISAGSWRAVPLRALQALALCVWPLRWQYQVYFRCAKRASSASL